MAPGTLSYGAPYVAVVEVPFSSLRAVVAKSTGAAVDQDLIVIAGSSGEPKTVERISVRTRTTAMAMLPSLMMS